MPGASPEWRLFYVRAEDVDAVWGIVEPFLAENIRKSGTDWTLDLFKEGAKDGRLRVWIVCGPEPVSAFVILEYADRTAEFVAFTAHRFMEWMPAVLPQFEALARAAGIERLRIDGRKGWQRKMDKFGFATVGSYGRYVVMEKAL